MLAILPLALKKFALLIALPFAAFLFPLNREVELSPAAPSASVAETAPSTAIPDSDRQHAETDRVVPEVTLAAIQACLKRAGESGDCLDRLFRGFLESHETRDALALIQRYEREDAGLRLSCHPVVHAVGRETFRKTGTVHGAFTACDQTCHSGCYHGAMERFLRGSAASDDDAGHISVDELRAKVEAACDPNEPTRFRFQCLHGLGHAIMFFSDYRLRAALASCDVLPTQWDRSSCYGGLFMENVFSATPAKRDLSVTDYHYPCNAIDAKYRSDCYMMQTTRMSEMGLSTERLFRECRAAGEHRYVCMQSIGRDLSNDARVGDPRLAAAKCELGAGQERAACTRGVAYALIDNTWDGRYAFPFCAAFGAGDDAAYCLGISRAYLQSTYARTAEGIAADCQTHAPGVAACSPGAR